MKLRELIEKLNKGFEVIKGKKYDGNEQYKNIISFAINDILRETELGELLKNDSYNIRLVKKEDVNKLGAGDPSQIFRGFFQ
jgi:hypothetical protein